MGERMLVMRMRMNTEELVEQCVGKKLWVHFTAIIPTGNNREKNPDIC